MLRQTLTKHGCNLFAHFLEHSFPLAAPVRRDARAAARLEWQRATGSVVQVTQQQQQQHGRSSSIRRSSSSDRGSRAAAAV